MTESQPTLLLVHGHPFDRSMWRPQVERFGAQGWRVLAPDLRGYGENPTPAAKTPLEVFAGDLVDLLDRLGVNRVVLAGLSMGGQIALEFHRLFRERLAGLVLADTSAPAETGQGRKNRTDLADRLLREGMEQYARELLPKMVAAQAPRAVREHVLHMMRNAPVQGAAAALRGRAERPDYVDMLAEITVPTLVVVGSEDEFTPLADAQLLHERIPGSRLAVIEGAGHLPNLERPAEFDAALAELLLEARPAA
ncbi:alpha/beta fold hydrolase [Kutzneria viridogrisea]|uniref:Pimeloyl-ACP methyl ester carboxylesterase n=1 Tax=Kutzneria viridogrisea TaxID=47990 RepID=A0ABR6BHD7_9PSEU|nr:pimeloyl-ACP methyl ester carboxylesterase [Kutzneria viridogrisea]